MASEGKAVRSAVTVKGTGSAGGAEARAVLAIAMVAQMAQRSR
jgi:hypothetical protein